VNFSYEIKILQPHICYEIYPKRGIIPANGNINITIKFTPVTLGTCITKIQLFIGQHNFVPLECEVLAKAVSGVIESNELLKVQKLINSILITFIVYMYICIYIYMCIYVLYHNSLYEYRLKEGY
jgi:hypothetical protein